MPLIWTVLLVGNAVVLYDAWRSTPEGKQALDSLHERLATRVDRVKNCGGCARRREAMAKMVNRVHWDAERIVEGEDVPTVPEP